MLRRRSKSKATNTNNDIHKITGILASIHCRGHQRPGSDTPFIAGGLLAAHYCVLAGIFPHSITVHANLKNGLNVTFPHDVEQMSASHT